MSDDTEVAFSFTNDQHRRLLGLLADLPYGQQHRGPSSADDLLALLEKYRDIVRERAVAASRDAYRLEALDRDLAAVGRLFAFVNGEAVYGND